MSSFLSKLVIRASGIALKPPPRPVPRGYTVQSPPTPVEAYVRARPPAGYAVIRGDELSAPLFEDLDEPPQLAPGESPWLEYWDESAQARYWYNQITPEASWVEPDPNDVVKAPEEPEPDPEGMVPPGPNWTAAIDDQTGKETWVNDATGEVLKAGGAAADDRSVGSKGSTGKKGPRARRRIKSKGG